MYLCPASLCRNNCFLDFKFHINYQTVHILQLAFLFPISVIVNICFIYNCNVFIFYCYNIHTKSSIPVHFATNELVLLLLGLGAVFRFCIMTATVRTLASVFLNMCLYLWAARVLVHFLLWVNWVFSGYCNFVPNFNPYNESQWCIFLYSFPMTFLIGLLVSPLLPNSLPALSVFSC